MTGNKSYISNFAEFSDSDVTFKGCDKGNVLGKGNLNVKRFLRLTNVLFV